MRICYNRLWKLLIDRGKLSVWEHGKAVPDDAGIEKINSFTPEKE